MNNIKTLAILVAAAVLGSAAYGLVLDKDSVRISYNHDDHSTMRHSISNGRSEFVVNDEGLKLKAAWRGDYCLSEDGNALDSLDDEMEIEIVEDEKTERVVFESEGGSVESVYYLNGDRQPQDDAASEAAQALFLKFLRISGVKADARVSALLKQDGAEKVIAEINLLANDYGVRQYAIALVEQADLSEAQLTQLVGLAAEMKSDHDIGRTLKGILENEPLTPESAKAIALAGKKIDGDHDQRKLLEAFTKNTQANAALANMLDIYRDIESDYDARLAAEALLKVPALSRAQKTEILAAASRNIESDYDLRLILEHSAPLIAEDRGLADAWFRAFESLDSAYEQRRALEEAAAKAGNDETFRSAYLQAANRIDSEYDRKQALAAVGASPDD